MLLAKPEFPIAHTEETNVRGGAMRLDLGEPSQFGFGDAQVSTQLC